MQSVNSWTSKHAIVFLVSWAIHHSSDELLDSAEKAVGKFHVFEGGATAIADEEVRRKKGKVIDGHADDDTRWWRRLSRCINYAHKISLICASSSKLDVCNIEYATTVILNFHFLTYHHNFILFALTYDEKNYVMPNKPP